MQSITPPLQPRSRSLHFHQQEHHQQNQQQTRGQAHPPSVFLAPAPASETLSHQPPLSLTSSLQAALGDSSERSLSLSAPTTPCISRTPSNNQPHPRPQSLHPRSIFGEIKSHTLPLTSPSAEIHSLPSTSIDGTFRQRYLRPYSRRMSVQGTAGVPSLSVGPMAEGGPTRVESSRRGSVAANLSITQGLPIDLDRIDMDDDDDDYDDEESERLDASSFDGDIDEDSMAADDNEGSLGYAASSHGGCRASDCDLLDTSDRTRALRSGPLDMAGLAGRRQSVTVPRNKAFLRLLSLVEDDRQPLASEMEHEGQITRTIRHTNVQEWLRSSSAHLNQPKTPDDQMACSSSPTVVATAGLASPLRNQPGFATAPAAITSSSAPARDILFPTSPALSSVSSLQMNTTSLATLAVSTARPAKRKSIDDGGGNASPAESLHTQGSSRSMHPYKRLAMSPSGLRAQIAIGKNGRSIALPVSRSGPSSPLLVSRPVALPSAASVVTSRARSRSNAGMGPGGLSVLQANGGFSRMNLDDKMYENSC